MIKEMNGMRSCGMVWSIVEGVESSGQIVGLQDKMHSKIAERELKTTT